MPKTSTTKPYISTVGRRSEAVARVRLYATGKVSLKGGTELKKGDIYVNDQPINEYFRFFAYAPVYNKLLLDTETAGKYTFTIKTSGGGLAGQVGAAVLGMARALDKLDKEKYHKLLRDKGYLTVDSRTRERRKVGNAGKARRKKSSPKR
ncbi:MAG TPA: 30S ribosomal protein S9 [Patescibacteria group bacterium]|nr:30S ribosomal protein S9 [Patescibacteria group bacterium]